MAKKPTTSSTNETAGATNAPSGATPDPGGQAPAAPGGNVQTSAQSDAGAGKSGDTKPDDAAEKNDGGAGAELPTFPPDFRSVLYHDDAPGGQEFVGDAITEALRDGWVDTPAKLKSR